MFDYDVKARRTLVRERQAELSRDALRAAPSEPTVSESRIQTRRLHLGRFRFLRPARSGS
jgi:hypothetical protein